MKQITLTHKTYKHAKQMAHVKHAKHVVHVKHTKHTAHVKHVKNSKHMAHVKHTFCMLPMSLLMGSHVKTRLF